MHFFGVEIGHYFIVIAVGGPPALWPARSWITLSPSRVLCDENRGKPEWVIVTPVSENSYVASFGAH